MTDDAPSADAFLRDHRRAALATGRRDGSPKQSMVVLPADRITARLDTAASRTKIAVDVATATVSTPDRTFSFDLPELRRVALLDGLDDLDLALRMNAEISAFETADRNRRPRLHTTPR